MHILFGAAIHSCQCIQPATPVYHRMCTGLISVTGPVVPISRHRSLLRLARYRRRQRPHFPDYVNSTTRLRCRMRNSNGVPNWNDPTYPGYGIINSDGVNDNFDWGAMRITTASEFPDTNYKGWLDTNGDGVNDKCDKTSRYPNHHDLDGDNDGIPDGWNLGRYGRRWRHR